MKSSRSATALVVALAGAWACHSGYWEAPACPEEADRFMPLTATMEVGEPPADTAGDRTYVICPDGSWEYVEGDWAPDNSAEGDFEVARADPDWVVGVDGYYCFSWLELQAWAVRVEYDYAWGDRGGGAEVGPDMITDSVVWCEP
ncbi:MAG: hypothetical protein FJ102_21400 [Deltaproteobacteria bacterium]|nr:hypothetical protein [Deltaproteobacteria bacterium]